MRSVGIAELKSHLSAHLKSVRRGYPLTVLDRDTPVARIVPYDAEASLVPVRRPLRGSPPIGKVPLPPPLRIKSDIVQLLRQERGER